ncbi:MAG: glycosyltransferase involved in cell wall biosynthesis [Alteromonadaceae bacterium]|jgi:glycosyltransferase involved in cell wall biosynthesis
MKDKMKKNEDILISIIIPTCNRPMLLHRALQKIQEQTYSHFEVLIINNGTKPELVDDYQIIEKQFDQRFKFLNFHNASAQGFGPSIARNIGIDNAEGDYIAFCDDDDEWIDRDYLFNLEKIINTKQPLLILSDQYALITDQDTILKKSNWLPQIEKYTCFENEVTYGQLNVVRYFSETGVFPHLNISVYKTSWLKALGGFNKCLWYEEDLELFLRALQQSPTTYFYNKVVANHYVPKKALKQNVTSDITEQKKHLSRFLMTINLIDKYGIKSSSPLLLSLASSSSKHLCAFAIDNKQKRLAKMYAQQALVLKPSLKWALYTTYLKLITIIWK